VRAKYGASMSRSLIHVCTYPTYFLVDIVFAAAVTSGSLIVRNVSTASIEKTTYEPSIGIKSKIADSLPESDIM
jgi:hypothetical protein